MRRLTPMWTWRPLVIVVVGSVATGCRCDAPPPASDAAPASAPSAAAPSAETRHETYELIQHAQSCEARHRGVLMDFGTPSARARRAFHVEPIEDVVDAEREGMTVSRVMTSRVSFDVVVDEAQQDTQLTVRAFGGSARSMWAVLDDRRLGTTKLTAGDAKVSDFPVVHAPLAAGTHRVTLGFAGRSRGVTDAYAELDWMRLGPPDEASATYAAPTFRDVITDAVLDGIPRRAFALRAPASLRCPVRVAADGELRAELGFWGDGKGSADFRIVADGEAPTVLSERKLAGGAGATWIPIAIPLKEHAGRVVALELRALESTKGGRVLFGDPAIVRAQVPTSVPAATNVVVVIAAGLDRRAIPPWGATQGLTTFAELARSSAIFSSCRAPSTVAAAAVASILTGLPPHVHALEDPAARLPAVARTLSELMKEGNGRTAMFTSAPTTFAAFGFDSGWDHFEAFSPVKDIEAAASITGAAKWLDTELSETESAKHLVVVHARGAHPPWDLNRDEAAHLPPEEYSGPLDPRRGGVVLSHLRSQKKHKKKLTDEDWTRLRGMITAALVKQDVALGELIAVLKRKKAWDSTLFVLMGDVSPGDPPEVPFDPAGSLGEDRLLVPLLVKFPKGELAAKEVNTLVTDVDVTATILAALRLKHDAGLDLYSVAQGMEPLAGRGLVATLGDQYATRYGHWLLRGGLGKQPMLCQLDVDPACMNDVFADKPIAGWAAWQWTYDSFERATQKRIAPREPASIDPDIGRRAHGLGRHRRLTARCASRRRAISELNDRIDDVGLDIGADGVRLFVVVAGRGFFEIRVLGVEPIVVVRHDVAELVLDQAQDPVVLGVGVAVEIDDPCSIHLRRWRAVRRHSASTRPCRSWGWSWDRSARSRAQG